MWFSAISSKMSTCHIGGVGGQSNMLGWPLWLGWTSY